MKNMPGDPKERERKNKNKRRKGRVLESKGFHESKLRSLNGIKKRVERKIKRKFKWLF